MGNPNPYQIHGPNARLDGQYAGILERLDRLERQSGFYAPSIDVPASPIIHGRALSSTSSGPTHTFVTEGPDNNLRVGKWFEIIGRYTIALNSTSETHEELISTLSVHGYFADNAAYTDHALNVTAAADYLWWEWNNSDSDPTNGVATGTSTDLDGTGITVNTGDVSWTITYDGTNIDVAISYTGSNFASGTPTYASYVHYRGTQDVTGATP